MKGMCTYCGENPIHSKGLCRKCYQRNWRNGTPELHKRGRKFGQQDHPASERKIEVWKEQGRSFTKAAQILGCSRQAVHDAVKLYFKPTNADNIRSMTDEELAEWIAYRQGCFERQDKRCSKYGTCRDCWFDWLKQEAKDD